MDKTCFWYKTLAEWIERNPLPPIPFVNAVSWGQYHNPPAEHLEIAFLAHGHLDDVRIGDRHVTFPANHVSLHNVHFGNYSARYAHTRSFCLFLDVTGVEAFARMRQAPFCTLMPVIDPTRLALAFQTVTNRCRIPGIIYSGYLTGTLAYDPNDRQHNTPARQLMIKAALLELLAVLLDNAQALQTGKDTQHLSVVRLAMEFITKKYDSPDLTLTDIADAVHLSTDYFGAVFRKHTHTTPMRYLRTVRIEQSKILMRRTPLTLAQIAHRVGFHDPLHFSRVFRQITGQNPQRYRLQNTPGTSPPRHP